MGISKYIDQGAKIGASRAAKSELGLMKKQLDRDLDEIMKTLRQIPYKALSKKERKRALRKAMQPLIAAAQSKAPVMRGRRKATVVLGDGTKLTYYPRNLALSIREIVLPKSPDVFVGPKVMKRRRSGDEYGKTRAKVDAYYAAMIEYGTRNMSAKPYMRPAFESTKGQVMQIAKKEVETLIKAWAAKNKK